MPGNGELAVTVPWLGDGCIGLVRVIKSRWSSQPQRSITGHSQAGSSNDCCSFGTWPSMGCFIGVGFKDRLGGSPTGDVHPLEAELSHLKPAIRVTVVIFTVRALQANQCAATRPALGQCVCPRWHGAAGRHQAVAGARAWGLNFLRRCLLKPPDLFRTPRRAELECRHFRPKHVQ